MKFLNFIILGACFALLPMTYVFGEERAASVDDTKESKISISHSGSRGPSPVYEITVFPDGLVLYTGFRHVKKVGKEKAHIDPMKYNEFIQEFERIRFFSIIEECPMAMDIPLTTVSVTVKGEMNIVRYNVPCGKIEGLPLLEEKIEETVNSKQWTR